MLNYANEILSKIQLNEIKVNPLKSKKLDDAYILFFSEGSKQWRVTSGYRKFKELKKVLREWAPRSYTHGNFPRDSTFRKGLGILPDSFFSDQAQKLHIWLSEVLTLHMEIGHILAKKTLIDFIQYPHSSLSQCSYAGLNYDVLMVCSYLHTSFYLFLNIL